MRTVMSFSVGLDSTYVLWKILSTTNDDVTAIILDTSEVDLDVASMKYNVRRIHKGSVIKKNVERAEAIQNWLKTNVRDFTLEVHKMDLSRFRTGLAMIEKPNTTAQYVTDLVIERINNNLVDRFVVSDEKENDGASHGGTKNGIRRPGTMETYDRFVADATRGQIDFLLLDSPYNQANALTEMPQELIDLTHSCSVNSETACGNCFKCRKRKFFCDEIASGKTPQEIQDIIESNSVQDDGTWISMKFWLKAMSANTLSANASSSLPVPKWNMPQWPTSYKVT